MRKKTDKTKTKIQIKSIWDTLLFEHESETIKDALVAAVSQNTNLHGANLHGANLHGADLHGANLRSANLHGANLHGANLHGANLRSANLQGVDLQGVDLQGAYLRSANLHGANLHGANLYGANLYGANLQYANLRSANLHGANLQGAYLRSANLHGANLQGVDLQGVDLQGVDLQGVTGLYPIVPEEGSFIGFKKLSNGSVAKIMIPEDAERIGGYTGRKCRAQKAVVIEGTGFSQYDNKFEYKPGAILIPDKWDNDPRVECSHGIHFFLTRKEAENY